MATVKKKTARKSTAKKPRKPAGRKPIRYPAFEPDVGPIPLDFSLTPKFAFAELFVAAINSKNQLVCNSQQKPNGSFGKTWTAVNNNCYDEVASGTTIDGRVAIIASQSKTNNIHYIAEKTGHQQGQRSLAETRKPRFTRRLWPVQNTGYRSWRQRIG